MKEERDLSKLPKWAREIVAREMARMAEENDRLRAAARPVAEDGTDLFFRLPGERELHPLPKGAVVCFRDLTGAGRINLSRPSVSSLADVIRVDADYPLSVEPKAANMVEIHLARAVPPPGLTAADRATKGSSTKLLGWVNGYRLEYAEADAMAVGVTIVEVKRADGTVVCNDVFPPTNAVRERWFPMGPMLNPEIVVSGVPAALTALMSTRPPKREADDGA